MSITLEFTKSAKRLAAQAVPSWKITANRLGGADVEGPLALLHRLQGRDQHRSGWEAAINLGLGVDYYVFLLQRRLAADAITCFIQGPGSL